jgi:UDP-3-O-[3-hydroxymyristoyl] N-acetylglucosamine deacetylase
VLTGYESAEIENTLQKEVSLSGIGLFTGERVNMTIHPAPSHTGIVFQRIDLPGKPLIPAKLSFIQPAPRCTRLGTENGSIYMVEHLLSALHAYGIDHARIELDGPEIPSGDGSAKIFVDLLEEAGKKELDTRRKPIEVKKALFWSEGEIHLVALPSPEFRLSYTLHYPQSELLGSQYFTFTLTPDRYKNEIAPSRTFSLYEEILPLIERGMIKGGGVENALVIKGDQVLNPDGVRFADEMVRHKILDLIGDLSLIGSPIKAHIIAIKSGHASNVAFAKILAQECKNE